VESADPSTQRLSESTLGHLPTQLPPEVPFADEPDEVFDRYARLVRAALGVPVGLVSLVSTDGQALPGAEGLPAFWQRVRCTGLSHSFCQYVVAHDAPLVVRDAREDPVLVDNLAIDDLGVIAYAGFPLHDPDGNPVGSLCAIDTQPRDWTRHELDILADLAATASRELTLRRATLQVGTSRHAEQAATEQVTQIIESMAMGYLLMDHDWRIDYVNTQGRRILGAAGQDVAGQVLWELFPATTGTLYETNCRRAVQTGRVVSFDAYHPAPLNTWFEVRATPTPGPAGTGMALYFLDVSARHDAEAAARRSEERLSALGQVALALAQSEDIDDLVTTMAERGLTALGADGGSVAVPDPEDADQLLSYITANVGEGTRADFGRLPLTAPAPVTLAARTGERVLLRDAAECAAMSPLVLASNAATGCQAWASIPLRADEEVIGVLTAGWAQAQTFPPEQLELLDTFAAQCAQALQRLRSRDAERASSQVARVSAERQEALVVIAHALASAQDQDAVLAVLGEQGRDLLEANGCGLCLLEDDRTHVVTLTTDSYAEVRTTVQRVPADFPLPAIRSAATGVSYFLSDRRQTEAAFPGSERIYTGAGVQASAAVPLVVRGYLLGCLSVGFATERTWTEPEQALLEAFAALTAQALERITAHEAEVAASTEVARFSETLQRSLLTSPPEPDHLHIAVRYSPAGQEAQVGGDWYDAFITADGATSLVIGDVTGHDRVAAAAMGQLRNLLRGITYAASDPPAAILTTLDHAAHDLDVDTTATLVLARIEQTPEQRRTGERLLRWSNAGHPPPLLVHPDGTVAFLETPADLMLGVAPETARHDHQVVLEPGSTLLLYTDGLIERRGSTLPEGMDWLAGAVTGLADVSVDELCDELLARVGNQVEDDVALLAVRAYPEDRPRPVEAGPGYDPREAPTVDLAAPGTTSRPATAGSTSGDPVDPVLTDAEETQPDSGDSGEHHRRAVLLLDPEPAAVGRARNFVHDHCCRLTECGDLCDTLTLLVSEVVTNAILHGRSQARLLVEATSRTVRVEVSDDNSRHPVLTASDPDALDGRGLAMIDMLATAWGVRDEQVGKTVWMELHADG
jgi:PAS domain S-box-containing protein